MRPGARGDSAHPGSMLEQAVQALDVQGPTDQIPLPLHGVQAAHAELAKAQNPLNPADGCCHQPLALGVGVPDKGTAYTNGWGLAAPPTRVGL